MKINFLRALALMIHNYIIHTQTKYCKIMQYIKVLILYSQAWLQWEWEKQGLETVHLVKRGLAEVQLS